MTIVDAGDPEWDSARLQRLAELEANDRREAKVSVLAQRLLRDRVRAGELADDVSLHRPEPDHGG